MPNVILDNLGSHDALDVLPDILVFDLLVDFRDHFEVDSMAVENVLQLKCINPYGLLIR